MEAGAPRLLDLSRLAARLGRGPPTGIDRVERAWLDHLLALPGPLFALVRTGAGFVLLDRAGAAALAAIVTLPAAPDRLARLTRGDPRLALADTAVRALAKARAPGPFLGPMLRRHLPAGTLYLNLGHTNLAPLVFRAVRSIPGARAAVFVHDTIPLDHPEFSRPDRVAAFRAQIAALARHADVVIFNSAHTRARAEHWFARFGRVPAGIVAPLGVAPAAPDPGALPFALPEGRALFLCLGTIEPRKNHALLLDVWDRLARRLPPARMPVLVVAGSRGWAAPALFARLDAAVRGGHVIEAAGLSDGAVAALLERAAALLFPSLAEGFGLPLAEALAAGTPVVAAPLPAFREIAGDNPVYLDPADPYAWMMEVERLALQDVVVRGAGAGVRCRVAMPGWVEHCNRVLTAL